MRGGKPGIHSSLLETCANCPCREGGGETKNEDSGFDRPGFQFQLSLCDVGQISAPISPGLFPHL